MKIMIVLNGFIGSFITFKTNSIQMKKMLNIKLVLFLLVIGITALTSCTKMDDFKKYVEDGEISYTGRVDSLKIRSGRNRVLIQGLFISDRKVTKCKIYWNSRQDSIIVPVVRTLAVDTLKMYVNNLFEGSYNFEIVTYDGAGNPSIPVVKSGVKVYGDNYEASLINMPTSDVSLEGTTATITWGGLDQTSGAQYMDVYHINTAGVKIRSKKLIKSATATLLDYKYRSTFDYRTVYLPDTMAIDTFYTAYRTGVNARTDVTATFIANPGKMAPASTTGTQFQPVSTSQGAVVAGNTATWRRLASWISNAAANNWGTGFDTFGTYVQRTAENVANFGTMSLEAGKNTTTTALNTITNGKIYQTQLLPAGEYSLEARVGNASLATVNSVSYFVATIGTQVPDVEVLAIKPSLNALVNTGDVSYTQIKPAATGVAYTISFNFTIDKPTQISFGFVATLIGTTTANNYLKVSGVRMKSLAF
jgi:hypothetical protein